MFDILVVLVVGLSTAFAVLRGGLRELSTLLAVLIAGGLTLVLVEPALDATGQTGSFFGTAIVAIAMVVIFFIVAHIGLHLGLNRMPLEGGARLADRVGGGVFGLLRGLVLVGLGYLGYTYYLDEARQPEEVKNAVTRPVAAGVADLFEGLAPESAKIENVGADAEDEAAVEAIDASLNGYARSDRNGLSEIVTTVTTTDPLGVEEPAIDPLPLIADPLSEESIADILIEEEQQ